MNIFVVSTTHNNSFVHFEEPIICKINISENINKDISLPIRSKERLETLMPFWMTLQPLIYNQYFQKKAYKTNTCTIPTLSNLFLAVTANSKPSKAIESQQCLATDRSS